MADVCIICSKEKFGIHVADTKVVRFIRKIKRKFKIATNNKLLVCAECMEEYTKRRKSFERKIILHALGGLLLLLISVFLPIMSGRPIEFVSIFMVLLLAIFLVALALLNYIPSLSTSSQPTAPKPSMPSPPSQPSKTPAPSPAQIPKPESEPAPAKKETILHARKKHAKKHAKKHGKKKSHKRKKR
ncbi:MAG: hypothetical protein ABIH83_00910 [Candidatus Micrarchaeota archaeon]